MLEQETTAVAAPSGEEEPSRAASPTKLTPEQYALLPTLTSTRFEDILKFERGFCSAVRALRVEVCDITQNIGVDVIEMWARLMKKTEKEFPEAPSDAFEALYKCFRPKGDTAVVRTLRSLR